jgi:hypothetical protein
VSKKKLLSQRKQQREESSVKTQKIAARPGMQIDTHRTTKKASKKTIVYSGHQFHLKQSTIHLIPRKCRSHGIWGQSMMVQHDGAQIFGSSGSGSNGCHERQCEPTRPTM